jgi:hypothetical protein
MAQHARAKVVLVLPFNLRHRQKTVDQILPPTGERMARGSFVLNDVSTLQSPRPVHRRKPSAEVTHESKHPTNYSCPDLSCLVWTSAEALEHFPDQLPVVPFLVFNLVDAGSFFRIPD